MGRPRIHACRAVFARASLHTSAAPLAEQSIFTPGESSRRPRDEASGRPRRAGLKPPNMDIPILLQTLAANKSSSKKPTAAMYNAILKAVADLIKARTSGLRLDESASGGSRRSSEITRESPRSLGLDLAMAVVKEAEKEGVDLGPEALDHLGATAKAFPHLLPSLIKYSEDLSQPSPNLLEALTFKSLGDRIPEQLVQVSNTMLESDMEPSRDTISRTVQACCDWGCPRLAADLVNEFEKKSKKGGRVGTESWIDILISSADNHYLEGVELAWERLEGQKAFTPDDGLIRKILDVAGRWGKPELGHKALKILAERSIPVSIYHLTAILEAYVNDGQVPNALRIVNQMRSLGMTPTMTTVELITSVLRSADIIDQAFYGIEDMRKNGEDVDVVALNAVIRASVRIGDLRRVRATQVAAADLGIQPNVDTFNLVIEGCIATGHRALGDTIWTDMASANITPNEKSYHNMILLCLLPQTYEDAFFYLEKMKAQELKPSARIYNAIMRKCLLASDERWKLVEEEMRLLGYECELEILRLKPTPSGESRQARLGSKQEGGQYGLNRDGPTRRFDSTLVES